MIVLKKGIRVKVRPNVRELGRIGPEFRLKFGLVLG